MTPLSAPVPIGTVAHIAIQSAAIDASGNVVIVWGMLDGEKSPIGRQQSVLPASLFAAALAGPASGFSAACEAVLASLLVAAGEVGKLPAPPSPPASAMPSTPALAIANARRMRQAAHAAAATLPLKTSSKLTG
jgi:hypothetical protein